MLESEARRLLANTLAHYASTFAQHFESLEKTIQSHAFFWSHPILVVRLHVAAVLNRNNNNRHVQPIHNDAGITCAMHLSCERSSNMTEQYICTGAE